MPTYQYEKDGEVIERFFPFGKAPQEIDGLTRVMGNPIVIFKGGVDSGFTRPFAGMERNKVTWDDVRRVMGDANQLAKETEEKKESTLTDSVQANVSKYL